MLYFKNWQCFSILTKTTTSHRHLEEGKWVFFSFLVVNFVSRNLEMCTVECRKIRYKVINDFETNLDYLLHYRKSNLSSLFGGGQPSSNSSNESLTYTAPKQPKKQSGLCPTLTLYIVYIICTATNTHVLLRYRFTQSVKLHVLKIFLVFYFSWKSYSNGWKLSIVT